MVNFDEFSSKIDVIEQRDRLEDIFIWIDKEFPQLEKKIGWNQPMYTDHGTYIIGFSASKKHMAVAPEQPTIRQFEKELTQAEYDATKEIFRIKWTQPVDYDLLRQMIQFNIEEKADYTTFWRK